MVARTCNSSYLGGWGRRIAWTWEAEFQWAAIAPLHSSLGDKQDSISKKASLLNTPTFKIKFHHEILKGTFKSHYTKKKRKLCQNMLWSNCFKNNDKEKILKAVTEKNTFVHREANIMLTTYFSRMMRQKRNCGAASLKYCKKKKNYVEFYT